MRGTIAVSTRWAHTIDRDAAMQPLWKGRDRWFEVQVDPELKLDPETRARLVKSAKKAHYTRLAFLRIKVQRQKRESREKKSATSQSLIADGTARKVGAPRGDL